jgi:hypothetical protein
MNNSIFKTNTMIIEFLNTILLLVFFRRWNLSLKIGGMSWRFYRLVQCAVNWKMLKIPVFGILTVSPLQIFLKL